MEAQDASEFDFKDEGSNIQIDKGEIYEEDRGFMDRSSESRNRVRDRRRGRNKADSIRY